jgi:hypothetical protein
MHITEDVREDVLFLLLVFERLLVQAHKRIRALITFFEAVVSAGQFLKQIIINHNRSVLVSPHVGALAALHPLSEFFGKFRVSITRRAIETTGAKNLIPCDCVLIERIIVTDFNRLVFLLREGRDADQEQER